MQKECRRLVLCGGGSGGHLTPSLAVAKAFLQAYPHGEVLFLISNNGLDRSVIEPSAYSFREIQTGKLRRYFSWENFLDFFRFIFGFFQSLWILFRWKPDIVFSKGGFVALPPALAAYVLRIPIVAHESDTVPGLANRIIGKFARKVCVTFRTQNSVLAQAGIRARKEDSATRFIHTGTPIRPEVLNADLKQGKSFLGFEQDKPVILFMGASQGAQQINDICERLLPELSKVANIVLVAGKNKLINTYHVPRNTYHLRQFEYLGAEFPNVLAAADIVISRAGANSLFELAALSKASIIIPLNSAAGDHQRANARVFEAASACKVFDPLLPQKDLDKNVFETIQDWLKNPATKKEYEHKIHTLFVENAAERIVTTLAL